jgi:hypothetical protein
MQGVSKKDLKWYSKCYGVASVTKMFTFKGSADANSEQHLQGSSVTSEEARTDCIASVNKVVQQLISRIIM